MNKTLSNPYYLFSFQHIASKERVSFIPEVITSNVRYDKFRFEEGQTNLSLTPPKVLFPYDGQYYYSIYEQISPTNTDIALAYNKLESGRAVVIVNEDQTEECFFEPYISTNEIDANVIFLSEQEEFCISGDTTPECPPALTGSCPTFLARYSPTNSIYFKNTGTTANFLSIVDSCAPVQVAFDSSRMFMVDGCSNYYQYDYTITSGGCFNLSLVNKWDVWPSTGITPNASYTMGIYDDNNLIIGESAQYVLQTGSTLYLYNLTTSGITKWLEIGNAAQVSNVYYNTANTQTILSYASASGGTGYYQLYSGSTNPQLISQIPGTYSNAGSTIYFSGNTPIAVNVAGLQFALDFAAQTVTLLEYPGGIPIYYVNFGDGFGYLSNIAQPVSCYNFDINVNPPTPSPTATVTSTPNVTPTVTPTITLTPTPSSTPFNPSCYAALAGSCPLFITHETPQELYYYDTASNTNNKLANLPNGCAPDSVVFNGNKMYIMDGCSYLNEFNYSVSPEGCFTSTFIQRNRLFNGFPSVNSAYGIAVKDSNTLFVGNTDVTGTTLYEYNLTTSGLTEYMTLGSNAFVLSILYNTGNTQMVVSYVQPNMGNNGAVKVFSGTTELYSIATSQFTTLSRGLYWNGTDVVGINNLSGNRYTFNFTGGTTSPLLPAISFPGGGLTYVGGTGMYPQCQNFNFA